MINYQNLMGLAKCNEIIDTWKNVSMNGKSPSHSLQFEIAFKSPSQREGVSSLNIEK